MPSKTTQAVAARVANDVADELRQQAQRHGLTVSDVVAACVRQALGTEQRPTDRRVSA
jgi:antitoxin component of RelBE/YafQ-DinJ toxin-antitoxin module